MNSNDPHNLTTEASGSPLGGPSRSTVGMLSGRMSHFFGGGTRIQAIARFLRRNLWAWPIFAAFLLGTAGWLVNRSVEDAMREQRTTDLKTILAASVTSLKAWMGEQRVNVELIADDEQVRRLVGELLELAHGAGDTQRQLVLAKSQATLRSWLEKKLQVCGYVGYLVVTPEGLIVATDQDILLGKTVANNRKEIFSPAIAGQTLVSKPFRSILLLPNEKGELRSDLPTMFVAGPIRDAAGKPIAGLGLRIRPEDQFTRILKVSQFGETGETYAFDKDGLLLSQSRFDEDLKKIGLLVDEPESRSILTVKIRDPGVNMVERQRPKLPRSEQPLTRLAADAVQGNDGYDPDGYRDYRGVPSVGAWRWLKDYDFGVATEIDVAEAFRPVYILRRAIGVLLALLVLAAIGIFLAMLLIARQQRALQKAALEAKHLGQYALEEKLGAGGMGTVYKARHAMLRRPTAVKLLDIDKMSHAAIARFEREVQLTSGLTHPNTVAIFDYGRTPEGIFYYAMEYLEGLNLDDLVKRFGRLPEARLVYILRQICGSLAEAHMAGLVHRDVKPANIFLTCRGGQYDFVKVLDFGLVKSFEGPEQAQISSADAVTGTPLYLSPEAINRPTQVDARADVYAIGAVGYFLLTGSPVFAGASVMEILMKHVRDTPEPPSVRIGQAVSPALEALLLRCLAKLPADRPRDAADLLRELEEVRLDAPWTRREAADWWATNLGPSANYQGRVPAAMPVPSLEMTQLVENERE